MIRVVFDTNILVSALVYGGAPEALLLAAAAGIFPLYSSPSLKAELLEVLDRFDFAEEQLRELEHRLDLIWLLVEPKDSIAACSDPDDDRVLECAVESRASHIVTNDNALLALDPFREIRIVRAARFLAEQPWREGS